MDNLFPGERFGPERVEVSPGAVHLRSWLDLDQQRFLVDKFDEWSKGPVPIRAARVRGGHQMSVRTVCLGWHWAPYEYTRLATDVNGQPVLDFPDWLEEIGQRAVEDAYQDRAAGQNYHPDAALVNFYDDTAKMGMHQDKDELIDAPVVSLSIGDACTFRFGNTQSRNRPYTDVRLESGDLFVFGGASRFAFHGVPKVLPGTSNPECGLQTGRINITLRATGLSQSGELPD